jgi:glycoprotein endo-alpha-1,2-mannosidase
VDGGKPLYYIYDSYHISPQEWDKLLAPGGPTSIRGTKADGVFIGLWLDGDHGVALQRGGFDGFYSYFGSVNFSYGSSPKNWQQMKQFADDHDMIFIASVGCLT